MKQLKIMLLFILIASFAQAQTITTSPFKRIPKPVKTFSSLQGLTTNQEVTAYRFSAPTAMFLYPQKQIGTSLGFGYNRMHFVDSTGKYYTDFAINAEIKCKLIFAKY